MNQQDDFSGLAARNLRPGERSPPSNRTSADPARTADPRSVVAPDGIDTYDSFCGSVIEHSSNRALMIEGYRVPSSLAAMVVPEPMASPSRSMASTLMEFGGAAVVAMVVSLFVTGELTAPWNIGASRKTEGRFADVATPGFSAPSLVERSAPSQSPAAAVHLESQSQSVRMVGAPLASAVATSEVAADAVLSRSPPLVSAKAGSDEADEHQKTAVAPSPTGRSENASPVLVEFVITRKLQGELKRVGCDPGNVDGDWNAASRRALENFNKHAGSKLDVKVASLDALGVIRSKRSRICPLACDRGSRVQGARCVPIETSSGRRNADRNHMKRASAGRSTPGAAPTASPPSASATSEPAGVDWRQNANF
jgi:hypothetical protein